MVLTHFSQNKPYKRVVLVVGGDFCTLVLILYVTDTAGCDKDER